jgi:hypothetical protein
MAARARPPRPAASVPRVTPHLARLAAISPGRVIGWIEDALAPLRDRMSADELHRLVLAIRATTSIEALVWLTDIASLPRQEATELMRSSARALLRDACREGRVVESS